MFGLLLLQVRQIQNREKMGDDGMRQELHYQSASCKRKKTDNGCSKNKIKDQMGEENSEVSDSDYCLDPISLYSTSLSVSMVVRENC